MLTQSTATQHINHSVEVILNELEQFTLNAQKIKSENHDDNRLNYNLMRTEMSKKIYLYTKEALDKNKYTLSSEEKIHILNKYIKSWEESDCKLDIKYTEYAELYQESRFGKYGGGYNELVPMLAGFDFEEIKFENIDYSFLIFLSNNFKNADFSNTSLPYAHFENCDFSGIKTKVTGLNHCRFMKCNFRDADLQGAGLCETRFDYCDITNYKVDEKEKKYPYGLFLYKCIDDNLDEKKTNKDLVSPELSNQLNLIKEKMTANYKTNDTTNSTSFISLKMKQFINYFGVQNNLSLTSSIIGAIHEESTGSIDKSDMTIIDLWLQKRVAIIKELSPIDAINVLLMLLKIQKSITENLHQQALETLLAYLPIQIQLTNWG